MKNIALTFLLALLPPSTAHAISLGGGMVCAPDVTLTCAGIDSASSPTITGSWTFIPPIKEPTIDALGVSTASLANAQAGLQGTVDALGVSTASLANAQAGLQGTVDALGVSTDTLAGDIGAMGATVDALGISTAALQGLADALGISTEALKVRIDNLFTLGFDTVTFSYLIRSSETVPTFKVGDKDQFGRYQIMFAKPGSVLRLGWNPSDGDPYRQDSEGIVVNGAGIGSVARIKPDRFGLTASSDTAQYYYRADGTNLYYQDYGKGTWFYVRRSDGFIGMGTKTQYSNERLRVDGAVKIEEIRYLDGSVSTTANISGGGISAVSHDTTLAGDGNGSPLNVLYAPISSDTLKIAGNIVSSATPANNDALTWDSGSNVWSPRAVSGGISAVSHDTTLAGDGNGAPLNVLYAPISSDTLKIAGNIVSSATPANNDALTWDSGSSVWTPKAGGGGGGTLWTKYSKTYSDLSAGSGTNDIELFSLPAKGYIKRVVVKHSTAFSGGSLTGYTVSVGIAGNLASIASTFNVFQAVSNTTAQVSISDDMENFGSTTSIRLAATATGDTLNNATAGAVDVWVEAETLP